MSVSVSVSVCVGGRGVGLARWGLGLGLGLGLILWQKEGSGRQGAVRCETTQRCRKCRDEHVGVSGWVGVG